VIFHLIISILNYWVSAGHAKYFLYCSSTIHFPINCVPGIGIATSLRFHLLALALAATTKINHHHLNLYLL
jgi:hypothetical protein